MAALSFESQSPRLSPVLPAAGFSLGSLFGLGLDLRAAQADVRRFKIADVKEVHSVCPYCAVRLRAVGGEKRDQASSTSKANPG